jgi:hypothetical protein
MRYPVYPARGWQRNIEERERERNKLYLIDVTGVVVMFLRTPRFLKVGI